MKSPARTAFGVICVLTWFASVASAQSGRANDAYRPPAEPDYGDSQAPGGSNRFGNQGYGAPADPNQGYATPPSQGGGYGQNTYGQPQTYNNQPYNNQGYGQPPPADPYGGQPSNNRGYANNAGDDSYRAQRQDGYGQPYSQAPPVDDRGPPPRYESSDPNSPTRGYYAQGEIVDKGRGFFGSITQGLASAIEYTYQKAGRPNGYILGEDGGGAFFAGLRYGEGMLYTKDAGDHKMFWQGPSLGYDVGGEGSKVMVLVYNMSDPGEIFHRFGGVEGSAYLIGGVSVQFQKHDDVTLAVIRSGVGLRLGANVGYLKYTRSPTWNPF